MDEIDGIPKECPKCGNEATHVLYAPSEPAVAFGPMDNVCVSLEQHLYFLHMTDNEVVPDNSE